MGAAVVTSNKQRRRGRAGLAGLLGVVLVLTSCAPPEDSTPPTQQEPLSAAEIVAGIQFPSSIDTYGVLQLSGLTSDWADKANVILHTDRGEVAIPIYADWVGDSFHTVIPYFFSDPMAGGTVELSFELDDVRGEKMPVTVAALPRADGGWLDVMDALEEWIEARSLALGTALAEIVATEPSKLDVYTLPIRLIHTYLYGENGNGLRSIPNNPALEDPALLDAMVAASDIASEIRRMAAGESPISTEELWASESQEYAAQPAFAGLSSASTTSGKQVASAASMIRPASGPSTCVRNGIEIATAQQLADGIRKMADSSKSEWGPLDVTEKALGAAFTVVGLDPGIVGKAAGLSSLVLALVQGYRARNAAAYPSLVFNMQVFDFDGAPFDEDFTDAKGSWGEVTVDAFAEGWDGSDFAVGLAQTFVSMGVGSYLGSKISDAWVEQFLLNIGLFVDEQIAGAILSLVDFSNGLTTLCEKTWTDISVRDPRWINASASRGRFEVEELPTHFEFAPKKGVQAAPFEDYIRIETDHDEFHGRTTFSRMTASVAAISISTDTEIIVKQLGGKIDVVATVHNAENPELDWFATEGEWEGEARGMSVPVGEKISTQWTRTHVAPKDETAYPYSITLEAISTTGLRESGEPRRLQQVTVRLGAIMIDAETEMMSIGSTASFTARDARTREPVDVIWYVSSGDYQVIDKGVMVFAAPSRAGTEVTITAVSVEHPDLVATAMVTLIGEQTKNSVHVQVGDWSHMYYIEGRDQHMCAVLPRNDLFTVRTQTDQSEFFELQLDEEGWEVVEFGLESDMRLYVAGVGPSAGREAAEYFGASTPIPTVDASSFMVEDHFAVGTISMLDVVADKIVTATITATCDPKNWWGVGG